MKENKALSAFNKHFGGLDDPRDKRGRLHLLSDILIISLLAIICGVDGFMEMEEFAKSKEPFLRKFLKLPHGIPSHDTFGRVFSVLSPDEFRLCFSNWVKSLCDLSGDIVNIDGKALRHSFDTANKKSMIHMVSAWANANNLVLGQVKVTEKSNEITAIPKLLDLLDLSGSVVTIDAMGTQKKVAEKIIDKQADYVLALKGNQGNLQAEVVAAFDALDTTQDTANELFNKQIELDHGRIEERVCRVLSAHDFIDSTELVKWKNLNTIIKIEATVTYKNGKKEGQQQADERYYISSLTPDAANINQIVRAHWGIETKLHWVLDVAFREDDSRVRKGHADENFSIARHIAVNKLKNERSCKCGIKTKRKKAGWENNYLLKVLTV